MPKSGEEEQEESRLIALEREKAAGMDKKGQTVQRSVNCAVAKGRIWRRENIVPAPFVRLVDAIGSTYGPVCPSDSHS